MVLPFVPVIPTSVSSSLGCSYSVAASAASDSRASGTWIQGRVTPLGALASDTTATAPRFERISRERRAVGIDTTERDEYGTRPCLPGVVGHGRHGGVADGRVAHTHRRTVSGISLKEIAQRHWPVPPAAAGGRRPSLSTQRVAARPAPMPASRRLVDHETVAVEPRRQPDLHERPERVARAQAAQIRHLARAMVASALDGVAVATAAGNVPCPRQRSWRATITGGGAFSVGPTPRCRSVASAMRLKTGADTVAP